MTTTGGASSCLSVRDPPARTKADAPRRHLDRRRSRSASSPVSPAAVCAALRVATGPVWLATDEACDIFVDAADARSGREDGARRHRRAPIDVLVQPVAGRRKRLLVADLESTIIENEMLDELGAILGDRPRALAEITRRAMNGEIDFADALAARVALLAGTETECSPKPPPGSA